MPRFDGTGPVGQGAMTGRSQGPCKTCDSARRPRVKRRLQNSLTTTYFKPVGIPLQKLEEVSLQSDELECLRLHDVVGLDQTRASSEMNISQPTFTRTINSAYHKIAHAIVSGKAIRIINSRQ